MCSEVGYKKFILLHRLKYIQNLFKKSSALKITTLARDKTVYLISSEKRSNALIQPYMF